jgi:hypothetical protein
VKNQDNYGTKVYIFLQFEINTKENKRSKITRKRQMLLIRMKKYELCLWLEDILDLQAAYKF